MRAASQSPSQPIGRAAPFCVGHRLADLLFDKHNLLNRNGGFCYLFMGFLSLVRPELCRCFFAFKIEFPHRDSIVVIDGRRGAHK